MKSFPQEIKFKYPWRSYQQRVINELSEYLSDKHLHVIAAPGSGKTTLGLEVMRRLNKPALILSPTITIRNQWVERFVSSFMPEGSETPEWITMDIKKPAFITAATYQALNCAFSGIIDNEQEEEAEELTEAEEETEEETENDKGTEQPKAVKDKNKVDVLKALKEAGVNTIVVDEAHHLRSEWWKSLMEVVNGLDNPTIVALTATPPYDVTPLEWQRYKELCGAVDAEISVPELVKEKNLCPHQDYVYLSTPSKEEQDRIIEFKYAVEQAVLGLYTNQGFINALLEHKCMKNPEENIEDILSNPSYYSSIAVFLNQAGADISKEFFNVMGQKKNKLPKASLEWMEILLTGCLYEDAENFEAHESVMKEVRRTFNQIGAIERRKVSLISTERIKKLLITSISKLNSIAEIVKIEAGSLGPELRMVVLTDYIRKDEMPKTADEQKSLNKIGIVPIFELIRRSGLANLSLGILSGTLVVIPSASRQMLENIAGEMGIKLEQLKFTHLPHDNRFLEVELIGADKQKTVEMITKLFSAGGVNVLIGTKSLLGEGWDAPSVNSLVLASFVGSYMLSNQMRGRAIRTQSGNPNKTANIWHLVCVQKGSMEQGEDLEMLTRRFKAFVGVSFERPEISDGINRLELGDPPFTTEKINQINSRMCAMALDRKGLMQKWQDAFSSVSTNARVVEEVEAKSKSLPTGLVTRNIINAIFSVGVYTGIYTASQFLSGLQSEGEIEGKAFVSLALLGLGVGTLAFLPFAVKSLWLFIKYGPVAGSMKQIGNSLLKTLIYADVIKSNPASLRVSVQESKDGLIFCSLSGGTSYEKSVFIGALQELLDAIDNPRYLIARKSSFWKINRKDYHAVPELIGKKKEYVEYLKKMWEQYMGETEIVYTRSIEGRRILLEARGHSLSAANREKTERISRWK